MGNVTSMKMFLSILLLNRYAYLHLEYQQVTMNKLKDMVVKHYTNQVMLSNVLFFQLCVL